MLDPWRSTLNSPVNTGEPLILWHVTSEKTWILSNISVISTGYHYDCFLHLNINSFRGLGDLTLHYCAHYEGSLLLTVVSYPTLSCRFKKPNFILIISQEMNQSVDWSLIAGTRICLVSAPTSKRLYALACGQEPETWIQTLCGGSRDQRTICFLSLLDRASSW